MGLRTTSRYPIERTIKDWIHYHAFNDLDLYIGEKLLKEYVEKHNEELNNKLERNILASKLQDILQAVINDTNKGFDTAIVDINLYDFADAIKVYLEKEYKDTPRG